MLPNCDNSGAGKPGCGRSALPSTAAAEYLDVEIADFLAQGIAVDPQQVGRPDLVPTGGCERYQQERVLDFAQYPVVEPGRRQFLAETREIGRQMPLDRGREALLGLRPVIVGNHGWLRELGIDHRGRDRLLRVERGEPAGEVFELAHIARPAVPLKPVERRLIELLR